MTTATPRTGPAWLQERLQRGEIIVIDGATGTELERRGVPMHDDAWCGAAMLEHGAVLQAVHEDYIRAGAEVIITNTFATSRQVLEPAGLGDQVVAVNREAAAIARRARDAAAQGNVAVAGSMSDFFRGEKDSPWMREATLRATYREQAETLAEGGVDLLAMEMMQEPEIAVPAIEAALATGLPVWVGVSCALVQDQPGVRMRDFPERAFSETLDAVLDLGAGLVTVMHSDVGATKAGIEQVRARWTGPIGAYPNSGYFEMPNWHFVDIITPDDFVAEAKSWIDDGVQIVGGCCGIGPEHIAKLKDAVG